MSGRLGETILQFVRVLRRAGLPVGPAHAVDAVRAVEAVGIERRDDLYWSLHAALVRKVEERVIFDQAFHLFWRNPKLLERAMGVLLPALKLEMPDKGEPQVAPRVAEAMQPPDRQKQRLPEEQADQIDAALTFSQNEILRAQDFEKMSIAELEAAKAAIRKMHLAFAPATTRRYRPSRNGSKLDLRAMLRASVRQGGDMSVPRWRSKVEREPPLVVLCDISGSMARYSRIFLHFLHALTNDGHRVTSFVFGTRLTNITRALKHRDVDVAVERAAGQVADWSGGTRIGETLHQFNRQWSRRVLSQGALVLLITDGLDRDGGEGLRVEVERLRKSCRRLIWLNPLLRFAGFQPKSLGIRAILPEVDEMRPVHNLDSLAALTSVLSTPMPRLRRPLELPS